MRGLAVCAGVAGIELGLKLALGDSYRTVCYVEREAFAAELLARRMEEGCLEMAPVWDDLESFDWPPVAWSRGSSQRGLSLPASL